MAQGYKLKDFAYAALIILIGGGGVFALGRVLPVVQVAEYWSADARIAELSPPELQNDAIVIVTVTEQTLSTLPYRSPVDRAFLATVLRTLDAAGARAIGVDILFDQPTEAAKDDALRHTMLNLSAPLRIAIADQAAGLTPEQSAFLTSYTQGLGTGYVNFVKDPGDGVVRWIYAGKDGTPGLVRALAAAVGINASVTPDGEHAALAYRARPDPKTSAFRTYPAHLVKTLPKAWFAGRIVLLGADLPLVDRHRTPFAATQGGAGVIPGVVIHAHALAQVLDGRTLAHTSVAAEAALILALAAIGMALALINLSVAVKALAFILSLAAYALVGGIAWRSGGVLIPLVTPALSLTLTLAAGQAYFGRRDRELKAFIRAAFSRYLSPALVERLIDDPSQLKVGGERRALTYLFTDITGFTALTERTDPAQLTALLNAYIDGMCHTALAHGATLDKIVGDATVCFFNAPLDQPDHPARAVACALAMDAFAEEFVALRKAEGVDLGLTRIGVHTGTATIGNFGGDAFFDYTAFGDMVNTAARLEGVNKYLGTRICVSEATAQRCPNAAFRPVGVLMLKGKAEGIKAFEPLGAEPASPAYARAYELMRGNDSGAADAFRAALDLAPSDPLAILHLRRLQSGESGDTIIMMEK